MEKKQKESNYQVYKEIALNILGRECENCGDRNNLLIHHIDCNRKNNDRTNLIVFCIKCHRLYHSRTLKVKPESFYCCKYCDTTIKSEFFYRNHLRYCQKLNQGVKFQDEEAKGEASVK